MSLFTHNLEWWCMSIRENLSSSSLSLFTLIGSASSAAAEAAEACVASPPSLFDTIPMVVMVERWVRQLTGEQRSKLMSLLQKRLKRSQRIRDTVNRLCCGCSGGCRGCCGRALRCRRIDNWKGC